MDTETIFNTLMDLSDSRSVQDKIIYYVIILVEYQYKVCFRVRTGLKST